MEMPRLYVLLPLLATVAIWMFINSEPEPPAPEVRVAAGSVPEKSHDSEQSLRSQPAARKSRPIGSKNRDARDDTQVATLILSPLNNDERSGDITNEIGNQIYLDGPGFFKEIIQRAEEGDADAAYAYFIFLRHCKLAVRTQRELDVRTIAWNEYDEMESADRDSAIRATVKRFNTCAVLDPEINVQREALEWLTLAADMGHMTAQLQYYTAAREELMVSLGLREPELIFVYHDRARTYLQNLLKTGHPESIFMMGVAMFEGIIYEKDDLLAFAYVYLAEREGYDDPKTLFGLSTQLQGRLTLQEVNEAKELSRELCESICAH